MFIAAHDFNGLGISDSWTLALEAAAAPLGYGDVQIRQLWNCGYWLLEAGGVPIRVKLGSSWNEAFENLTNSSPESLFAAPITVSCEADDEDIDAAIFERQAQIDELYGEEDPLSAEATKKVQRALVRQLKTSGLETNTLPFTNRIH